MSVVDERLAHRGPKPGSTQETTIDGPIAWKQIGQPQFDRVVEALLYRKYADAAAVVVYDGRGGDGGRDVVVRHRNGRRTVYQLKYYPEGFSNGFVGRRPKIRSSFKAALAYRPHTWILVTPGNVTTAEERYVKGLRSQFPAAARVRIPTPLGRAALDVLLGDFPDLLHVFTCNQVVEDARILGQEKALLLGPNDLAERVQALGRVADDRDPHWALNFERRGTTTVHSIVPKHPAAQRVSPLGFQVDLAEGHHDLAFSLDRSLGFGVIDTLSLPPHAVRRLEVTGPDWLATVQAHVAVRLQPGGGRIEATAELRVPPESLLHSCEGAVTDVAEGNRGRTLRVRFHNAVVVTFFMPNDPDASVTVDTTCETQGLHPATVLDCLALLRTLSTTSSFDLLIDGERLGAFITGSPRLDGAREAELDALELLASDLDALQRHCRQRFAIPDTVSALERVRLRCARLLIDGHCIVDPEPRVLNATLNGRTSAVLDSLIAGEAVAFSACVPSWQLDLFGRTFDIGPVALYHPEVRGSLAPAPEPLGSLAGRVLRFKPAQGRFQLYKPHLDAYRPGPTPDPVPLGLPGYPGAA